LVLTGIDSDLVIDVINQQTSGLIGRIDADSDRLVVLSQSFVDLQSNVVLTDDFNTTLLNSTAYTDLQTRIDVDSNRLSIASSNITSLEQTVDGLVLTGIDSDLVIDVINEQNAGLIGRIDADSDRLVVLSQSFVDLQSNVVLTNNFNTTLLNSTAYTELQTRIDRDSDGLSIVSSDLTSLEQTVSNLALGGIDSDLVVQILNEQNAGLIGRIDADSDRLVVLSQDFTDLQSNVVLTDNFNTTLVNSTAYEGLTSSIQAVGDSVTAVAGSLTELQLEFTNLTDSVTNTASLVNSFDVRIDAVEGDVTSIKAEYVLTTDVNGHISGIKLLNTGSTSEFTITADKFNIVNASNNAIQPFSVDGNNIDMTNVRISGDLVTAGTITAEKLTLGADLSVLNENPSFEADAVGWEASSPLTNWQISTLDPRSGTKHVRVSNDSGYLQSKTLIPVSPGEGFRAEAFIKAGEGTNPVGAAVFLRYLNAAGTSLSTQQGDLVAPTSSYTKITEDGIVPENAVYVQVGVVLSSLSDVIYIDDVRLFRRVTDALIVNGSISTEKLLVASKGSALNSDPNMTDPSAWTKSNGNFGSFITVSGGLVGNNVLRSGNPGAQGSGYLGSERLQLDPNKTYRMTGVVRKSEVSYGDPANANGKLFLGVAAFDSDGSTISGDGSYWSYGASNGRSAQFMASGYNRYSMEFGSGTSRTFPTNARSFSPLMLLNYQSTAGFMEIQDVRIEEQIPSALIVKGGISADRLSINSGNNLVTDVASFEQYGILGSVPGSSSVSTNTVVDEVPAVHGKYILKHTSTGSNSFKYLHPKTDTAKGWIRIEEGERYIISGYVRTTSVADTSVSLNAIYKTFGTTAGLRTDTAPVVLNSSDGWVRVSTLTDAIPSNVNASYAIYVRNSSSGVTTYWDAIQIEKYNGSGTEPSPFNIGGTTTIDGGSITTGTISANRIDASGLITANQLIVQGANISTLTNNSGYQTSGDVTTTITSYGYQTEDDVTTTITSYGFTTFDANDVQAVLDDNQTVIDGARITTGFIDAARINLNAGVNLITDVASFEQYGLVGTAPGASGLSINTVVDEVPAVHGRYVLKHVSTGANSYKYLNPVSAGDRTWIRVEGGEEYIISGYVRTTSTTDTTFRLQAKIGTYDATGQTGFSGPSVAIKNTDGWVRMSAKIGPVPAGDNIAVAFYVRNVSSGVTSYWDAFQLEKYNGNSVVPSPFTLAGTTTIDGGSITTGTISADRIDTTGLVVSADISDFITASDVDDNVVNPTNFNLNKTTTNAGRTFVTPDGVKIQSWNGSAFVTRVKLGNLSAL
jgi:hypothetical protein